VEDHRKVPSTQILIEVEVVELQVKVNMEARMVDIINMKVNFMEVDEKTLKEREVMEAVVEVIKVNNQTMIQIATTVGNLGTW
jgi:hypothetical protein